MATIDDLHYAIQTRPRPEDVAQLVLEVLDRRLTPNERQQLTTAARFAMRNTFTSMSRDFTRPDGAVKQVKRAVEIFAVSLPEVPSASDCLDSVKVRAFMDSIAKSIQANIDWLDFKTGRMNREQRKYAGLDIRKRGYNRRFRMLRRLQDKLFRMEQNLRIYEATRIAKSAGATKVTRDDLGVDLDTACFIAYHSARMSLRSAFTFGPQVQAFDNIGAMLYKRATESPTVNWWAIALIHPEQEVLRNLSDEQKGRLLGFWTETLHGLANMLHEAHSKNNFALDTMIVRRGNDSTTWNALAGAWNKARDSWMKLVYDLGMSHMLETYCPGKVLRLMAADIVAFSSGLHPDTFVWAALPKPWEVFKGTVECPRALVEEACRRHSREDAGWTGPKADKRATTFTPTPELVHGVAVSSPYLAMVLKKAGWFSGKALKDPGVQFHVEEGPNGVVVHGNSSDPLPGAEDDTLPPQPVSV